MAKVSVIIPIYNVEKYLQECLDSVIDQTLKDIEIILVDDGSPDNCPRICDEYAQKDARIKVIHKENGGYGSAVNRGLEEATGEYIGIVEPDDYIDSDMYEDLYNIAQTNNADIVKSDHYTFSTKNGKQQTDSIPTTPTTQTSILLIRKKAGTPTWKFTSTLSLSIS